MGPTHALPPQLSSLPLPCRLWHQVQPEHAHHGRDGSLALQSLWAGWHCTACPAYLLLGGCVAAPGLSFHFSVTGQGVTAWHRPDSTPRVVLAWLPPAQIDARGTP